MLVILEAMNLNVRESTIYKLRHLGNFLIFALVLFILLSVEIDRTPPGLSPQEMQHVVSSVTLNPWSSPPETVINVIYHLMQKFSITLFGLSPLSIKLPSMILAALTACGMIIVLRHFFKYSTTALTILFMISSLPFLTMGRTGSPLIMLSFLSVMLMVAGTFILNRYGHGVVWKLFAFVVGIALLYTPLGIYPLIAFTVAAFVHPHLRYHIAHTPWWQWVVIGLVSAAMLSLLVFSVVRDPSILFALTGVPSHIPGLELLWGNLTLLGTSLFNLTEPKFGYIASPLFGLPLIILMTLGFVQLFRDRYSARAYFLMGWILLFTLVLLVNPDERLSIMVSATLVLAVGVEALLREWYSLFPRNPYARALALLPLTVLLIGIVSGEATRYFNGFRYAPSLNTEFDRTLLPLKNYLNTQQAITAKRVIISVPNGQEPFYDLLRREHRNVVVRSEIELPKKGELVVVLDQPKELKQIAPAMELIDFDVSTRRDDNILYRVYTARQQ